MRADAHEQRALQLEHANAVLGDPAADLDLAPSVVENYWAAAFHWLAYGCQQKHGQHKENHTWFVRYLRDFAETEMADRWDSLERIRQGALYAYQTGLDSVNRARDDWQVIRTWALA